MFAVGLLGNAGSARADEEVPVAAILRKSGLDRKLFLVPHMEAPAETGYLLDDIAARGRARQRQALQRQPLEQVESVHGEGFYWTVRFTNGRTENMKWPTIVDEKGEHVHSFGGLENNNTKNLIAALGRLDRVQAVPLDAGLKGVGRDLTALAKEGKLRPAIGREPQLRQVVRTLLRDSKATPLLMGEPGVGKSAIVEELARQIAAGNVPELAGHTVFELDLTDAVAGSRYRGDLEDKIKQLKTVVARNPKLILFIDELHNLLSAGGGEHSLSVGEMLKPILARPGIKVVGATTLNDHSRRMMGDGAFDRRFTPVLVPEPTAAQAEAMLEGLRGKLEAHHGVQIGKPAIKAAVALSIQHITDRRLPDKAIDLLDEAAAEARLGRKPGKISVGPQHVKTIMNDRLGGALTAPKGRR